jgi:hypothetical protein
MDLIRRVVWRIREREANGQDVPDGIGDAVPFEERKFCVLLPPRRRMTKAREPGTEDAVADLKMVIEKTQRPVLGECGQPQRQPRQLNRHRIEIDAVEASFGDRAADAGALRGPRSPGRQAPLLRSAVSYASPRYAHAPTRNAPLPIAGSTIRRLRMRSGEASRTSGPRVSRIK